MIRNHWYGNKTQRVRTEIRSRSNTTQDICQPLEVLIQEIQNFRLVARFYISHLTVLVTAI